MNPACEIFAFAISFKTWLLVSLVSWLTSYLTFNRELWGAPRRQLAHGGLAGACPMTSTYNQFTFLRGEHHKDS